MINHVKVKNKKFIKNEINFPDENKLSPVKEKSEGDKKEDQESDDEDEEGLG